MAACNKSSSNNSRNDDSNQPPEPSATSIATNSHDSHDSTPHPPHPHLLPPPLPSDNDIFSSPPPPPPPSCSSSSSSSRILSYTKIKSQGKQCWSSMKSNFNKVVREPARKRRRRWSSSLRWSSEESSGGRSRWNNKNERDSWPEDEEESRFCESLVGLMRRCGRMGVEDEGLGMTIADADDDGVSGCGKEGRGSDSSVPQGDLSYLGP